MENIYFLEQTTDERQDSRDASWQTKSLPFDAFSSPSEKMKLILGDQKNKKKSAAFPNGPGNGAKRQNASCHQPPWLLLVSFNPGRSCQDPAGDLSLDSQAGSCVGDRQPTSLSIWLSVLPGLLTQSDAQLHFLRKVSCTIKV